MRVRDVLFDRSPYAGFDPSPYPPDLQGWNSDHPLLAHVINRVRPTGIVEVGSWKGGSAIHMAKLIRQLGLPCELVCVDTWLGSPEHWMRLGEGWYEALSITHGHPQLYTTFMANVVREELTDIITPFPSTSDNAAHIMRERGIYFDIAYIDAAHEYGAVKRDLENYWSLLREPGVLIGDDFRAFDGVTQAALEFATAQAVPIHELDGKFIISKGRWYPTIVS
jgi:predicted O-methyltransferase YrrM